MVGTASEISTRRNSRSMAAHFDPIGLKAPDRGLLERADAALKTAHNTEKKLAALLRRERQLRQEEITTEIIEL